MSKIAVVFWSGSGNTEAMAQAVLEGAVENGAQAELFNCVDFSESLMDNFDSVAFGCPSMGAEELEDTEFAPMYEACRAKLSGKKIALFGSYGWGDGEWMRNWDEQAKADGAEVVCDYVICNEYPDEQGLSACKNLGAALV